MGASPARAFQGHLHHGSFQGKRRRQTLPGCRRSESMGLEVYGLTSRSVQFSSVQFSSRWYLSARESPYALHPVSQTFPQCSFLFETMALFLASQVRSLSSSSIYSSLLQAIDAGRASSFDLNTSEICRDASRLSWLLFPPVYLLCYIL